MPVQGKKKPQSRGSQGRRRPAAAPRTAYTTRAHQPWYQTRTGRLIAGLVLLGLVVGIAVFARSRSNNTSLTSQRNKLDQYTGDIRSALQAITPAATAENAVPNKLTPALGKLLKKQSALWIKELTSAQRSVGGVLPPTRSTQSAAVLFVESIQLYTQAANLYGLAPSTSSPVQVKMLTSAAHLRDQASAIWQEGTNILDQARSAAKMVPSGFRLPTSGAVAPPSPTPSPSASGGGKNKKHHKNKKNGGGGNGSK